MTRLRKEIRKEMDELYMQEQAEYEMGCGFGTNEIAAAFAPAWEKLYEKDSCRKARQRHHHQSVRVSAG